MALVTYNQLKPKYGINLSRASIARKMKMQPPQFPQCVTDGNRIHWHSHELEAHVAGLERGPAINFRAKKAEMK